MSSNSGSGGSGSNGNRKGGRGGNNRGRGGGRGRGGRRGGNRNRNGNNAGGGKGKDRAPAGHAAHKSNEVIANSNNSSCHRGSSNGTDHTTSNAGASTKSIPSSHKHNNSGNNSSSNNKSSSGMIQAATSATKQSSPAHNMPAMRDEEVLIAFMPHLKSDNNQALQIHATYQSNNNQKAFLQSARTFLATQQQPQQQQKARVPSTPSAAAAAASSPTQSQAPIGATAKGRATIHSQRSANQPSQTRMPIAAAASATATANPSPLLQHLTLPSSSPMHTLAPQGMNNHSNDAISINRSSEQHNGKAASRHIQLPGLSSNPFQSNAPGFHTTPSNIQQLPILPNVPGQHQFSVNAPSPSNDSATAASLPAAAPSTSQMNLIEHNMAALLSESTDPLIAMTRSANTGPMSASPMRSAMISNQMNRHHLQQQPQQQHPNHIPNNVLPQTLLSNQQHLSNMPTPSPPPGHPLFQQQQHQQQQHFHHHGPTPSPLLHINVPVHQSQLPVTPPRSMMGHQQQQQQHHHRPIGTPMAAGNDDIFSQLIPSTPPVHGLPIGNNSSNSHHSPIPGTARGSTRSRTNSFDSLGSFSSGGAWGKPHPTMTSALSSMLGQSPAPPGSNMNFVPSSVQIPISSAAPGTSIAAGSTPPKASPMVAMPTPATARTATGGDGHHTNLPTPAHPHPNTAGTPGRQAEPAPMTPDVKPRSATPGTGDTVKVPTTTRKEYQPKRLWTHLEQQPGRILANGVPASTANTVVDLRPRQELTAKWMLPLSYLRERSKGNRNVNTLRDALQHLSVGLYRRGCTENGTQASIVTKEVLSSSGDSRKDFPFQVHDDKVVGTVPFHSPRTPGHVVFRLYWQDEPIYTLATGPNLNVRITEDDFESSLRFILSNFKSKKLNPTSLSSLNSLSIVLDQFRLSNNIQRGGGRNRVPYHLEGAGRAIWGCVCESRKVVDTCASEHLKTSIKLEKLEETVEELKAKIAKEVEDEVEEEKEHAATNKACTSDAHKDPDERKEPSPLMQTYRDKMKALMSGRASCERKWRDSQLAFASILKAVVTNASISIMLRPDLVSKMSLEYQLWCPLCEEFATLTDNRGKMWYEPLQEFGNNITPERIRMCVEARSRMQIRTLGFVPNTHRLENVLYTSKTVNERGQMNPRAVNTFNHLSAAMGQMFQETHADAESVNREREAIRLRLEKFVQTCNGFPSNCRVVVFGSAANGFGTPKSDLDMCLQLPPNVSLGTEEDPTGANAMASLAKIMEENGMQNVDTARLTARIPVIKFDCPRPSGKKDEDGEVETMECDLSVHNPLAVLNTSLLRTYAEINPVVRVLASIVKKWAKARDINNPARHTLSSYGYILMLLHFLTFHKRAGNGLYASIGGPDGKPNQNRKKNTPILPNLQWVDNAWPEERPATEYRELGQMHRSMLQHPFEERIIVNTYFYRPNGRAEIENLQRLFPGQDLSLAILLASFFRYYAFEFDYKRHVISLHSTAARGVVEREVKAELDGWRNYSAALTIEDPFETFYDVAHVLRGGYYHRIRREFAVAYSKIADIASGQTKKTSWKDKKDLTTMSGSDLIEWICEPIATEREEA